MNPIKTIWSLLFRLFPCPTRVGLRRIGSPGRGSPILVTGNFHLTVRRVLRAMRGRDAWLVVARSAGINVWCAAGAGKLSTRSVVAALKTSGVAERVDHGTVLLPPLAGPAVRAVDVEEATGLKVRWGPVRAADLPAFIDAGLRRDESMKRTTWTWRERLDAGVGTMFPFYFAFVLGFAAFAPSLLLDFAVVSFAMLVSFLLAIPVLPGRGGLVKALALAVPFAAALWFHEPLGAVVGRPLKADLIIALASLLGYGVDVGGMSPIFRAEFDQLVSRLGVREVFGVAFAGSVRTDLLRGVRALHCDEATCIGCRRCVEICPRAVWEISDKTARPARPEDCTGCTACFTQCPVEAISAQSPPAAAAGPRPSPRSKAQ